MPALIVRTAASSRSYQFTDRLSIGRADDNDVRIEEADVSRHHAAVSASPAGIVFVDLGSANGSSVNGMVAEPRVPVLLRPGDVVTIPGCALELEETASPGGAQLLASTAAQSRGAGGTLFLQAQPAIEVSAPGISRRVALEGDEISLGRSPENQIVIEAEVISRKHLVFRRAGATYTVTDAGSTNGFEINGTRVALHTLREGDVIEIAGAVRLTFRLSGEAAGATTPEEKDVVMTGPGTITVGRHPGCDMPLAHPAISLMHARITTGADGERLIEDLGSTNGTFVNGVRLAANERRTLSAADVVHVGPIRLHISAAAVRSEDASRHIRLTAFRLQRRVSPATNLLQDISLVIEPNEFVAVVGVSGSGKSTLLGALSGLRPASGGDVLLNGISLYTHFDAFRTALGYVPQDDILHPELPVRRALAYAAELRLPDDTTAAERLQRVDAVMATLGLEERGDIPVGRLSGGQRKRVSIGAELLTQPGLFFLDEATSGLDPGTESHLMRLLRKLADEGNTVLLITHATKNVMLCDQVLFLAKGGHLAYFGPPDRALRYFGVEDFDGIYELLESEKSPEEWDARYRASGEYMEFIAQRLAREATPAASTQGSDYAPQVTAGGGRTSGSLRQFRVLSLRYFDIIRRDKVNLALLFLLAPALAMIDLIAWPGTILDRKLGVGSRAMTMLFLSALLPFLVGSLSSVREIVKEAAIYARERSVALAVWPYLGSKVAIGSLFALYHAAALFALKVYVVDFPGITNADFAMLYVTLFLGVVSGVMWALVISSLTRREEQAMMLVIGLVVLQVVFSGGLVPLDDLGPVGLVLGSVTSTGWAFKALATASGLSTAGCTGDFAGCNIPGVQALETTPERSLAFRGIDDQFGGVLNADVAVCWGAMLGIIVAMGVILYVLQRRKDTL